MPIKKLLPNTAWCDLKSHRLLAGESPVLVRVRPVLATSVIRLNL